MALSVRSGAVMMTMVDRIAFAFTAIVVLVVTVGLLVGVVLPFALTQLGR